MGDADCPSCKGRPRSDKSRCAILKATLDLLAAKPLRDITIEAVARKAGVGKATIYKWWPSKAYLALDAFLTRTEINVDTPDTGSARADFAEQLKSLIRFYTSKQGRPFAQFVAECQICPDFAASFRKIFLKSRREVVAVILQRGVRRGEIRERLDTELVLDLLYGPVVYRLLTGHGLLNDREVDKLVATVFDGIGRPARR